VEPVSVIPQLPKEGSMLHGNNALFMEYEQKRTIFLWRCKEKPRR
jgi:hypothetical protein